jgi:hypothetical protein
MIPSEVWLAAALLKPYQNIFDVKQYYTVLLIKVCDTSLGNASGYCEICVHFCNSAG